ncbi:hypothetical protein NL108_014749 [Boleophthalmus pectinirostris]|nr:hypothetical protein NL108_014749 [Boleophthalmus pectinirostris]
MFLLPRNISLDQVEKKQRSTKLHIDAPPKCKLVINRHYRVTCPTAERVQPKRSLFDLDHEPNYYQSFQLHLLPNCGLLSISLTEDNRTENIENTEVWRHELNLTEVTVGEDQRPQVSPWVSPWVSPRVSAVQQLELVRSEFVQRVSDEVLKQLLDKLQQEKVLTPEEAGCRTVKSREDKARYMLDTVKSKGEAASSVLIRAFCELDPWSDLCRKLRTEDS